MFNYNDYELWRMTPRKLGTMLAEYQAFHGRGHKKVTIDDVIPF